MEGKIVPFIKIGISKSVNTRFKGIQAQVAQPIKVVYETPLINNSRYIEAKAQKHFEKYNTKGEWFYDVSSEDIIKYIESIKNEWNNPNYRVLEDKDIKEIKTASLFKGHQYNENIIKIDKFLYEDSKDYNYYVYINISKIKYTLIFENRRRAENYIKKYPNKVVIF